MDNKDYVKIVRHNLYLLDELKEIIRYQIAYSDENNKKKALFINNYLTACLLQYRNFKAV